MSYLYLGTRCLYLEYAEYFFPRIVRQELNKNIKKYLLGTTTFEKGVGNIDL
jgi:hypothetical protein